MVHKTLQMDSNERIMAEIERTKIGLIPIIGFGTLALIGSFAALFMVARFRDAVQDTVGLGMAVLVIFALTVLFEIFTYIAYIVYVRNKLIVTNESIIQHLQRGLFHRHISQLNVGNVEDVTVNQNGILAHWLNYGTIIVETAGEQSNFKFKLAKEPYKAAETIIECHEAYLKMRPDAVHNA